MTNRGNANAIPPGWATHVRGSLMEEGPGARGIERLARNPACLRLLAIVGAGVSPATVAIQVYGLPDDDDGQSPFAIGAGNQFERRLYEENGARLLDLYRARGRLSNSESKVVNIADVAPGRTREDIGRRKAETLRLLRLKQSGAPTAPNVIIKPRFEIPLLGAVHGVEPDHLVASDSEPTYRTAEVKAYPDRRGKTDMADLRGALRQAAVGVVAVRLALSKLGVWAPERLVRPEADIVLRRPGSFLPTLNSQAIVGEVDSIRRTLRALPASLTQVTRIMAKGETIDDRNVIDRIPNNYKENCREHCALARACRRQALEAGDPIVLGGAAREMLAPAGSIPRALELLRGRGAPSRPSDELLLQAYLRTADDAYTRAVNYA